MRLRHLALPFFLASLAGCALMPDYQRPASPVPAEWPEGPAYRDNGETDAEDTLPAAEIDWREFFADDPRTRSNFICSIGYGDPSSIFDRSPRPDFDRFNRIA